MSIQSKFRNSSTVCQPSRFSLSVDLKRLAGRDGKRENYLVLRISVIQYLKGKIK